jgi:hypothetical protein
MTNANKLSVRKPKGKRICEILRHRLDIIKMNHKETGKEDMD